MRFEMPLGPCGTVKLNTAADDVPELVTLALEPGAPVVVVPTATVAALPFVPGLPRGMVKFSTAAIDVPTLVTDAGVLGVPVVVVPTVIVAALPSFPAGPFIFPTLVHAI